MTEDQKPIDLFSIKTGAATVDYHKHPRKLTARDLQSMRIPREFWMASVEGIPEQIREILGHFIEHVREHLGEGVSLLLRGNQGVGKTSAAAVIAKRARAWRFPVLFTTWRQIRDARRNPETTMYDPEAQKTLWARASEVRVLIIDDITADDVEDRYQGLDLLMSLLRDRAHEKLTTIITTRLALDPTVPDYADSFPGIVIATIPGFAAFQVVGPNLTLRRNQGLSERLARSARPVNHDPS
jgi:DNA replication protein DnaC